MEPVELFEFVLGDDNMLIEIKASQEGLDSLGDKYPSAKRTAREAVMFELALPEIDDEEQDR